MTNLKTVSSRENKKKPKNSEKFRIGENMIENHLLMVWTHSKEVTNYIVLKEGHDNVEGQTTKKGRPKLILDGQLEMICY